eukprot:scaffold39181_cov28-Prasinocladus_malaysianus.AAC.1
MMREDIAKLAIQPGNITAKLIPRNFADASAGQARPCWLESTCSCYDTPAMKVATHDYVLQPRAITSSKNDKYRARRTLACA